MKHANGSAHGQKQSIKIRDCVGVRPAVKGCVGGGEPTFSTTDLGRLGTLLPRTVFELLETLDSIEKGRCFDVDIDECLRMDVKDMGHRASGQVCYSNENSWLEIDARPKEV